MSGLDVAAAAAAVLEALAAGQAVATVTVVADPRPDAQPASRMLVYASGETRGSLGDLDEAARALAERVLRERKPALEAVPLAQGEARLFGEAVFPQDRLIIVGAGHIAVPLAEIGVLLGFEVTVLDDREEFATGDRFNRHVKVLATDFTDPFAAVPLDAQSFVVLVTRAHKYDFDCLGRILELPALPRYIGMIGSRRRVRAAFDALRSAGYDSGRLSAVHAPVGLDIGAETPAEIAVSIGAEMVRERSGRGTGGGLAEKERVLERFSRPKPGT